jgi:hypothetical protein
MANEDTIGFGQQFGFGAGIELGQGFNRNID